MNASLAVTCADQERLSSRAAELLRWLGVPAFADGAATWKYGRIIPLIWMIAFQVGVLSAFDEVSAEVLIAAAPLVALLAFFTLPISASAIRVGCSGTRWLLLPLAIVPVLAFSWVRNTIFPIDGSEPRWLLPHYWCTTAITLVVLYTAMIVVLPQAQASSGMRWVAHWFLLIFAVAANLVSVKFFPLHFAVGDIGRGGMGQDISLPPLAVVSVALVVALFLPQKASAGTHRARSFTVAVPAAALILIFGLVNARLVGAVDRVALLVGVLVVSGILLLLTLAFGRHLVHGAGLRRLRQQVTEPRQLFWIPAFVIAYPVVLCFLNQKVEALGRHVEGMGVVAVALVFNLVYLAFVWVLVHFGVDQIIVWSIVEFSRKTVDTLRHIAASVPLLLIAVSFLALTAETWQIAYALPQRTLLTLCGTQILFAALLAIGWTEPRVRRLARFKTWDEVADAMQLGGRRSCDRGHDNWNEIIQELRRAIVQQPGRPDLPKKMSMAPGVNARLVVMTYQFFVFPVIVAVLFFAFLWLCKMAVSPWVAAEWIFGDGKGYMANDLTGLNALDSPWLRVPLFLTVFSILYLATHSLASKASRSEYFNGGDEAIRMRFAVRLGFWFARWQEEQRRGTITREGNPADGTPGAAGVAASATEPVAPAGCRGSVPVIAVVLWP